MIAPACPRAHSSVCSTSARVAFVSSVAWWRACSSSRAARDSASVISLEACCSASCVVLRASLLAAFIISARWRSLSWRYLSTSPWRSCSSRWRRETSSSVRRSCAAEAVCASRSIVSAISAAARIMCIASIRTACPVGSAPLWPAACSTRS